jgi:hypothetical protein
MNDTNKTTYATLTTYQPAAHGHDPTSTSNGQLQYLVNGPQQASNTTGSQYLTTGLYGNHGNAMQLQQQLNYNSQQLLVNMDDAGQKHDVDLNKSHILSPLLLLSSVSQFNTNKTDCGGYGNAGDLGVYDGSQVKCYKTIMNSEYGQHHQTDKSSSSMATGNINNGCAVDFSSVQQQPLVNLSANVLKRQGPHLRQSHTDSNGNNTSMSSDASSSSSSSSSSASSSSSTPQMEEINTKELAQRISSELKRYSIPQAVFAQRVLCRSQGTLSDLLRNPKPWLKLKSGRETFRRMWKWLQEPESQRMNALRLASKEMEDCLKGEYYLRAVD